MLDCLEKNFYDELNWLYYEKNTGLIILIMISFNSYSNEVIFHENFIQKKTKPPVVIALHSSGGYFTVHKAVKPFLNAGFAVYTPDFFSKHNITKKNRFQTWTKYRKPIEKELIEIVNLIKKDTNIDNKNIFAVGYSNGGYWASFWQLKIMSMLVFHIMGFGNGQEPLTVTQLNIFLKKAICFGTNRYERYNTEIQKKLIRN